MFSMKRGYQLELVPALLVKLSGINRRWLVSGSDKRVSSLDRNEKRQLEG